MRGFEADEQVPVVGDAANSLRKAVEPVDGSAEVFVERVIQVSAINGSRRFVLKTMW